MKDLEKYKNLRERFDKNQGARQRTSVPLEKKIIAGLAIAIFLIVLSTWIFGKWWL